MQTTWIVCATNTVYVLHKVVNYGGFPKCFELWNIVASCTDIVEGNFLCVLSQIAQSMVLSPWLRTLYIPKPDTHGKQGLQNNMSLIKVWHKVVRNHMKSLLLALTPDFLILLHLQDKLNLYAIFILITNQNAE